MQLLAKKEYIPFGSFMDGSWKEEKKVQLQQFAVKHVPGTFGMMSVMPMPFVNPHLVLASNFITRRIIDAFDPLFGLIQGISYPLCLLSISAGCILVMMGNKSRGIQTIKWACIGFIMLQFAPSVMDILIEVSDAMKSGN